MITVAKRGRSDRARIVGGFPTTCAISPITTNVESSTLAHGEVFPTQQYVIKFISDLRQVSGFLLVLWFSPSIKLVSGFLYQ